MMPRFLARLRAALFGYFWLPCPAGCGGHFGGHEWTEINGHLSSIPTKVRRDEDDVITSVDSRGICPACTAAGVGCRAHHEAGDKRHVGCEFLPTIPGWPPGGSTVLYAAQRWDR